MTTAHKMAVGVVTAAFALATAVLSGWRVSAGDGDALLRLSWRNAPIRVEECRSLTEEEQARMPAHMRRTEECTGYHVDYELKVTVDAGEALVDTVAPSGLRRDRPVYVLRDRAIPPGAHNVEVEFSALVPESYDDPDLPLRMTWSGGMELAPGEVGLITLDETGRTLVRVGPAGGGS